MGLRAECAPSPPVESPTSGWCCFYFRIQDESWGSNGSLGDGPGRGRPKRRCKGTAGMPRGRLKGPEEVAHVDSAGARVVARANSAKPAHRCTEAPTPSSELCRQDSLSTDEFHLTAIAIG